MLQVKNTETGCIATYDNLSDFLYHFSYWLTEVRSGTHDLDIVKREAKGGPVLAGLIEYDLSSNEMDFPFKVISIEEDTDPTHTLELNESYLLLRLSEEDVTQVLYFYGLEDLEASIKGDPTITFVDGYELSDSIGGCQIEIKGWLIHTQEWHKSHEEIVRTVISHTIQDIANAKKGRVNDFAFL